MGEIDHPEPLRRVRLAQAALVATTSSDAVNTNVALTVLGAFGPLRTA